VPLLTVGSATRRARITRPTVGPADCWLTGQSGAPPDSPMIYSRTPPTKLESSQLTDASLAHRTLSGAHRTVRCPLLTVGSATRRVRITRPTVGRADCWLTGQSGAPPDSPMIYSRTPPSKFREQPVDSRQPGASDTVRCTTGQSGAPRLSRLLAASSQAFPIVFSLILALRQTC
jgi:hypothetical protein